MFIQSQNIVVFPVAKARDASSGQTNGGRLFTEQYVANMIKQLINTNGFMISCYTIGTQGLTNIDANGFTTGADIITEFNINGYYFKVKLPSILEAINEFKSKHEVVSGSNYYIVAEIVGFDDNQEIAGQDEKDRGTSFYKGLQIYVTNTNQLNNGSSLVLLNLVDKDGKSLDITSDDDISTCKVITYNPSYQKFSASTIHITGIDGKP